MKSLVKKILHLISLILVSPNLVLYFVSAAIVGKNRALEGASQTISLLPGLPGVFLRRAFLGVVLDRCHPTAEISFGTLFSQCGAIIDEEVYVGPRCHLGLVHLEKDVLIAAGVHIPSGGQTHAFDDPDLPIREQGGTRSMVTIGAGAWVGSAAIVMADVGAGSIIAAGSVVTKPIPPNVIAAGVPARVLRGRFESAKTSKDSATGSETTG